MAVKIIPTVLARTREEFDQRLQKLLPVADELQVDFEDGRFVPSIGVPINEIPDLSRYPGKGFEAHLMVDTPGAFIQPVARRGFKCVIFHVEVINPKIMDGLLAQCRKYGVVPVLAINPETSVDALLPYVHQVNGVLFLGVHPGFNGAPYLPETAHRIAEFARKNPNKELPIQVDGGMTPATIGAVVAAGATRINSGSFISNAPNPEAAIDTLMSAAEAAMPIDSQVAGVPKCVGALKPALPLPQKSVKRITKKSVTREKSVSRKTSVSRNSSRKSTNSTRKTKSSTRKSIRKSMKSTKSTKTRLRSARPAARGSKKRASGGRKVR